MSEKYYKIKESTLTKLADNFRNVTGKTEILSTDNMAETVNTIALTEDVPTTPGQWACLARASQMKDIRYKVKSRMPTSWGFSETPSGDVYLNPNYYTTGIWYSSTRGTEWGFIGYSVSMYSLLTAINNPKSVIYKRDYADYFAADTDGNGAGNTYGTNCTSYASYCVDLPYLTTTGQLKYLECFVDETGAHNEDGMCWDYTASAVNTNKLQKELKLCDILVGNGHAIIVTGIRRDVNGAIQEVDISDSWWYLLRRNTYKWDEFVSNYIIDQGYKAYRYSNLESVTFPDNLTDIVYSDLCTSRGDKISIRPDQDIALNIISNAGLYAGIVLLKDGVYHSHKEGLNDWRLIDPNNNYYPLTTGKYTAILYKNSDNPTLMTEDDVTINNSTHFIVCNVSVTRTYIDNAPAYTSKYDYTAEAINGVYPKPMQITLKDSTGMTKYVHLLDEDEFNGTGTAQFVIGGSNQSASKIIHVPFKTEYGFVIAENGFDNVALEKPILPDDGVDDPIAHYTVTFFINGDSVNNPEPQAIISGGLASEPTITAPDGYIFSGWYTSSSFTTVFDFDTRINSNITLYGKLIYLGGDIEGTQLEYLTYPSGIYLDTGVVASDYDEINVNYKYSGSIASGGIGSYLFGALNGSRIGNLSMNANDPTKATIIFYLGSNSSVYKGAQNVNLKHGFTFRANNVSLVETSKCDLTLSIKDSNGNETSNTLAFISGSSYTNKLLTDSIDHTILVLGGRINDEKRATTSAGTFSGWSMRKSADNSLICEVIPWKQGDNVGVKVTRLNKDTGEYTTEFNLPINGTTHESVNVFTAGPEKSDEKFIAKFSINGDIDNPPDQIISKGEVVVKPTIAIPDGYILNGWYTSSDMTIKFDFSTAITEDITLYGELKKAEGNYQAVEYIKCTGDQYIDTGIDASEYSNEYLNYYYKGTIDVASQTAGYYLFGAMTNSCRSCNAYIIHSDEYNTVGIVIYLGASSGIYKGGYISVEEVFELKCNNVKPSSAADIRVYLRHENDSEFNELGYIIGSGYQSGSISTSKNIQLLAADIDDTIKGMFNGKFYGFTVSLTNGDIIRDFKPCYRISDHVAGVYDTVTCEFFENAGTGTFDIGENIDGEFYN